MSDEEPSHGDEISYHRYWCSTCGASIPLPEWNWHENWHGPEEDD